MVDKNFATVTDAAENTGADTLGILFGVNSREAAFDLAARFLRGNQINDQSVAGYTTVLNDAGLSVRMSNSSANTVTIPPNSSVAYKIGTRILVTQIGVGGTTIVEGSGVTINTENDLAITMQWKSALLTKVATDEWDLAKGGAGADALDDLTDVDLTTTAPRKQDRLVWDGTNFVPVGSSICILQMINESYANATPKVVTWTELEDLDGYFGGGTVADEQWVFPFTGRYRISFYIVLNSVSHTKIEWKIWGRKDRGATTTEDNDFPSMRRENRIDITTLSIGQYFHGTGIVDVTALDEMDLLFWHDSVTRNSSSLGRCFIEYLGPTTP